MVTSFFAGDIVKTIFFDCPKTPEVIGEVLTKWLVEDVGHKLDVGDLALMQERFQQAKIDMFINLNPNDKG